MGKYPSDYAGCMECPVENVSWFDAMDYAQIGKDYPLKLNGVLQGVVQKQRSSIFWIK